MPDIQLIPIGNSKGIRLPAQLIRRYGFSAGIRLSETAQGLLLEPVQPAFLSLEDSFAEMAADPQATVEARIFAESGLDAGIPDDDFSQWPK